VPPRSFDVNRSSARTRIAGSVTLASSLPADMHIQRKTGIWQLIEINGICRPPRASAGPHGRGRNTQPVLSRDPFIASHPGERMVTVRLPSRAQRRLRAGRGAGALAREDLAARAEQASTFPTYAFKTSIAILWQLNLLCPFF
jgi:hypothetical protein